MSATTIKNKKKKMSNLLIGTKKSIQVRVRERMRGMRAKITKKMRNKNIKRSIIQIILRLKAN